jgi:RimJ/RimL family protein N-acetyltransferase
MIAIGLKPLRIRRATIEDAGCLFAWRNDELTRNMSRNHKRVEWASHVEWLKRAIEDPGRILLIGEVDGEPVGTVRFDRVNDNLCEVSWTMNPAYRGHGYGTKLAVAACETIPKVAIIAEIRADNLPTLQMIQRCGFQKTDERDGNTFWKREPLI